MQTITKKIKRRFFRVLYKLLNFLLTIVARLSRCQDTLLIIRPDRIGDYVLFRNFLPYIRQSPKYCGLKISLLGNESYRTLAEALDSVFIDHFIWLDERKFHKHSFPGFWHTLLISSRLHKTHYQYIIYPVFSRTPFFNRFVNGLSATHKIACSGDNANKGKQPDIMNRLYTEIIFVDPQIGVFEFERNKEIISKLLRKKIELDYPTIENLPEYSNLSLPSGYIVICMETSHKSKQWLNEYFEQVIFHIINDRKLPVVLLGLDDSVKFTGKQIIDLRGKINLPEAACVLSKANCFIGCDSSLMHIAAATGTKKIIAICYGAHYGRFAPYPEISGRDYRFIFPPEISQYQHNPDYLKQKYADGHYETTVLIQPEQVISILSQLL